MGTKNNISGTKLWLLLAGVILFFLIVEPLLTVLLSSIILSYIFFPIHKQISSKIKNDNLSAVIVLILIVLIFLVPFGYISSQVPKQAAYIYTYAQNNILANENPFGNCEESQNIGCTIGQYISSSEALNLNIIIDGILSKTTQMMTSLFVKIPNAALSIVLSLFITFFFLRDGKNIVRHFIDIIPLSKKRTSQLITKFEGVTHSVVYAHIIVALFQGLLGAIGFYLFGIESAIFWGVVMAILSVLPLVGPPIVWGPAAILILASGLVTGNYTDVARAIGLIIYGIFIVGTSDNILRMKLMGDRGQVHPLVVLIGIIGGVSLFGLIGLFAGPIILSLLITLFEEFKVKPPIRAKKS
jgi:predicted PurR-regulated permease PerM